MVVNSQAFLLALIALLGTQLSSLMAADCPLDFTSSNFTLVASVCSNITNRGKCCRYMNAFVAISVARYANLSNNLGVTSDLSETCIGSISKTMELYGVSRNATSFCGLGTKILVRYNCEGRTTVTQMHQSPTFGHVTRNCRGPLSPVNQCRKCLNSGITYLRNLVGAETNNVTLSTCRDATYATLASRMDDASALELLGCFFQVTELSVVPSSVSFPPVASPGPSPSVVGGTAAIPSKSDSPMTSSESNNPYHLTLVPTIGIVVTAVSLTMLVVLVILIRRKNRELDESESLDRKSAKALPSPRPVFKIHQGDSSPFQKFSYKEMRNATNEFKTVIGHGGFGTVYKAEFSDGLVAAVKRMDKASEQSKQDFCREIELLAKLHHRNLVALKGFCIEKKERFLIYEYMKNGSLKDHLHSTEKPPLSWETRMKIAIDVANALEYLHFYCDPPLCHRDIKSSNILLDESFVAKLSDFGLAHSSRDGSVCFEPVNTDIHGTPGYVDPEYVVTQQLTEKSDVYSYGVVLLEIITGRRAVDEGRNLVETSQRFLVTKSRHKDLVDPRIKDSIDDDDDEEGGKQLEAVVRVVRMCTEKEGRSRPSIKQVLRMLCESCDQLHSGFAKAVDEEVGQDTMQRTVLRFQRSNNNRFVGSSSSKSFGSQSVPHSPINGLSF
ncbi:Protein kinase superfamily protein [Raphanus sativus]|uniref:Probable receptor-like protein kinase At1g49730 n=1 Tax=Raphanus sativus TaxID=3726 RepID=A0A6J0JRC5_RAPSA|nr:probable receptor-like protein kinase At1g49730 [Raphanus sativus]KAJ4917576.1 Protein kinase superfamily protein [Raphanus sativus]